MGTLASFAKYYAVSTYKFPKPGHIRRMNRMTSYTFFNVFSMEKSLSLSANEGFI